MNTATTGCKEPAMPPLDDTAYIHSVETCGAADGPGIRFVAYLQGCPLQCRYCHNPDARAVRRGETRTAASLFAEILHYKPYYDASGGGVTLSGGEPLLQPGFVQSLFEKCHEHGINTALDTAGHIAIDAVEGALAHTDLVLLDLKSYDPETHRNVTGVYPDRIHAFARHLAEREMPVWVRFVLVPGLTDAPENIRGVAATAAMLGNVRRVDVLPFHKMGEYKWAQLGLDYTLSATPPPDPEQVQAAVAVFREFGLNAF